ncbi:hypothetical protein [Hyphobacterium sp.]|uniref:hypothetical protein n=1 Tax=Hyphobacterium sp. TaxID=2004662 RepID=UPI003BA91CD7
MKFLRSQRQTNFIIPATVSRSDAFLSRVIETVRPSARLISFSQAHIFDPTEDDPENAEIVFSTQTVSSVGILVSVGLAVSMAGPLAIILDLAMVASVHIIVFFASIGLAVFVFAIWSLILMFVRREHEQLIARASEMLEEFTPPPEA